MQTDMSAQGTQKPAVSSVSAAVTAEIESTSSVLSGPSPASQVAASQAACAAAGTAAADTPAASASATHPRAERKARPKRQGAVQARKQRQSVLRWQRLAIQLFFFIIAPGVFSSAFSGVKHVFVQMGAHQVVESSSFLVSLIMVCLFTAVFGRFFCGYACAFGFLGDAVYQLGQAACKKLGVKLPRIPERAEMVLRYGKHLVLVAICIIAYRGFASLVNENSPWTMFSHATSLATTGYTVVGVLLLLAIVVGMVFKERFFCEFLCPLGALFSLLPILPFGQMRRDTTRCLPKCSACRRNCPVGIDPAGGGTLQGECISCGRCAGVCPQDNIVQGSHESHRKHVARVVDERNAAKLAGNARGGQATWAQSMRKAGFVQVLVKAVLLLVVFWLLGACRYLPAIM